MREWENEPDHVAFELDGYPCIVHRNPFGALCGYVGVAEGHPAFGRNYHELCDIICHGGLTYSSNCDGPICHPGEDKRWWLGFDCAHAFDFLPYSHRQDFQSIASSFLTEGLDYPDAKYKNIDFVKKEISSIVEQLKSMEGKK